MADPRFYRNRGPFALAALCQKAGLALPSGADGAALVADVAGLDSAASRQLSFFTGGHDMAEAFARTRAGFCLVPEKDRLPAPPAGTVLIPARSVSLAFAAIAGHFYPDAFRLSFAQEQAIHPTAKIGQGVQLAPGVVVGAGAEIGEGTAIGASTLIGPAVTIGKDCQIGSNVSIAYAHIGDRVAIKPGAQIGQAGFGFASSAAGHVKIPQLGRVIVQDAVEIGANSTVDRGALGDTVIGEGTKIDNLVQIAHNVQIGRHCILVSQSGMAGSSVIEDFVIMGGQAAIADHAHVGAGARLAGRTACVSGQKVAGGQDYGGVPAKPIRDWLREVHAVSQLIRRRKRD